MQRIRVKLIELDENYYFKILILSKINFFFLYYINYTQILSIFIYELLIYLKGRIRT